MEECVGIDDRILREVIIPVMAVSRRACDGSTHEEEPVNKSQIYITTAGYKNTFSYDRLIGMVVRMITQPNRCMVLGGTWRTPVATGLQSKTFIKDQKEEGTYNEASFEREYKKTFVFFKLYELRKNLIEAIRNQSILEVEGSTTILKRSKIIF